MRQSRLTGFEKYTKNTRKEQFLEEMDRIIPWSEPRQALKPYYPDPTGPGRRPKRLERMLRIYLMQHWFKLSHPGMEEALYDSRVMREFAEIDLGEEAAPDETTLLRFRHLLAAQIMGAELKNRDQARDPDMHHTKKNAGWHPTQQAPCPPNFLPLLSVH
jgi:transposase, IS5 family